MSIFQDQKGSNQQEPNKEDAIKDTENIYGGLEASQTLLLHGLESDWIEEEMADDDDFKYVCSVYISPIFSILCLQERCAGGQV